MASTEASSCGNTINVLGVRVPAYTVISKELFENEYWPKLQNALQIMLNQSPGEFIQLSYEDLYSNAYKCATQQYSEEMYHRIANTINGHLLKICSDLQSCPVGDFLSKFSFLLAQYLQAVDGLSSVFSYMDRSYIVKTFGKSFSTILLSQFTDTVVSRTNLFDVLHQVSEGRLEAEPHILMSVVKGLYSINPDLAKRNVELFTRFIPNIGPSLRIENLPLMIKETEVMQRELTDKYGFTRNPSNKRKIDEVTTELIENEKRTGQTR